VQESDELSFERLQLRPHALRDGLALHRKQPFPCGPTIVREPKESKRFRFPQTTLAPPFGRKTAKLDQACLVRVECQAKLLKAFPKFSETAFGVGAVLEPHDEIIRIAYDDHIALCVLLPPLFDPEVEDIV
jgi:hypothetical protein